MKFEEEFADALRKARIRYTSHTDSGSLPDYTFPCYTRDGVVNMSVELKEKRQSINMRSWPTVHGADEKYLFIVDELTVRKLVIAGPASGLVVRHNLYNCYTFFTLFDLLLSPRVRCNRPMATAGGQVVHKGKWVLDVRNGITRKDLVDVLDDVMNYAKNCNEIAYQNECFGDYLGENIPVCGEIRTLAHRDTDVNATIYRE